MSVHYQAVGWSRQKKIYDGVAAGGTLLYLGVFAGLGALAHPDATAETLLIRAFGTGAFLLLHVVLAIGPLTRLDKRFLPLLYNRRHLGVLMFLLALTHGLLSLIQFHALGNVGMLTSLVQSFPSFQLLGAAALFLLFAMAATSHDVWLHWLTPPVWKRLHMGVYLAYALLVAHVAFGALQSEPHWFNIAVVSAGAATLSALHITAARKERDTPSNEADLRVGPVDSIPDQRAVIVCAGKERIAVFRNGNQVHAVSNVCRHQNGPLGEGKIIDGCITCPWHGYQYDPATGRAPAPFDDQVAVFPIRIENGTAFVSTKAEAR
ncbi:MAG: ferric reductase-like transmembrane domain-containing protein [Acidobacteria bacterium]|nr:ferric reductase-like transmembrane domain-containing protein [Acidobacteriota bacterium]